MRKTLIIISFVLIGSITQAQQKNLRVSIEVDGVCMMCKKRIEKAALNTQGVKFASWDVKTHQLSLIIDERKTSVKVIKKNIAAIEAKAKTITAPIIVSFLVGHVILKASCFTSCKNLSGFFISL